MTNKDFTPEQKAANAKYQAESWSKETSYIIVIEGHGGEIGTRHRVDD